MSTRYLTLMICLQHCQGVKSSLNSISIIHINRFCLMRSQRSILLFTLQRDSFSINIYLLVYHQLLQCFNTPRRVYCRICLVYVYILVTGINEDNHLIILIKSCKMAISSIEHQGHVIDGNGIHPSNETVRALTKMLLIVDAHS